MSAEVVFDLLQKKKDMFREDIKDVMILPNEKLIVAKRRHWFVLVAPIAAIVFLTLLLIGGVLTLFNFILPYPFLAFSVILFFLVISLSAITKITIEWYFHLYIITTKKVLELWHNPPLSYQINDILLDKVRCTEIDIRRNGIINEIIDMGDVALTFDRPTHQEEFILENVKNPREIGAFLIEAFDTESPQDINRSWIRGKGKDPNFRYMEEILKMPIRKAI